MIRQLLAFGLAGILVALVVPPVPSRVLALASPPPQAAQEVSLDSLGLPSQTVHGAASSLAVGFPAPAASLSPTGSYLRVFFGNSRAVREGSRLQLLVNGQAVDDVSLSSSTAAGSVTVVRVPASNLHGDRPNLVEFRFALLPVDPAGSEDLFGRVDAQTALHHELAATAGMIEAHPFSLIAGALAGSLSSAPLGLVLPGVPDDEELGAAFRLVSDTSRLVRPARLTTQVVMSRQQQWLAAGGSPALLVGRLDDLPGSTAVLGAAGFTNGQAGWAPPGSAQNVAADDGMIAATLSPWDHTSPVILVTGITDGGVTKAAQALVHARDLGLAGHTAVVTDLGTVARGGGSPRTDAPNQPLVSLLPDDPVAQGPGDHRVTFGLPIPAADGSFSARLHVTLALSQAAAGMPSLSVAVNDHAVAAPPLAVSAERATGNAQDPEQVSADIDLGPRLLPGVNGVSLTVRLSPGDVQARLDTALSNFLPTPGPRSFGTLDQLPYPFLNGADGAGPTLVLGDLSAGTIAGMTSALAGLGSRANLPPAVRTVVVLTRDGATVDSTGSLVIVGGPAGEPLRLHRGTFDATVISPLSGVNGSASGWIDEVQAQPGGVTALWIGGDPSVLAVTAAALGNRDLRGQVVVVGPDGVPRSLPATDVASTGDSLPIRFARLLPLVVVLLLVIALALEVRGRRRVAA